MREHGAVSVEEGEKVEEIRHAPDDADCGVLPHGLDKPPGVLRAEHVAHAREIPVAGKGELLEVVEGGEVEEVGVADEIYVRDGSVWVATGPFRDLRPEASVDHFLNGFGVVNNPGIAGPNDPLSLFNIHLRVIIAYPS